LLGCKSPIILRAHNSGHFQVIGDAYIPGLDSGEALLGPFSDLWSMRFLRDDTGSPTHEYFNSKTEERTDEDPRLWPLPHDWERLEARRTNDDPYYFRTVQECDYLGSHYLGSAAYRERAEGPWYPIGKIAVGVGRGWFSDHFLF
jgi:hypothetical protein